MRQNYRNMPDILRFAKKFLYRLGPDYNDDSISMRETSGTRHLLEVTHTPSEAVDTLTFINDQLGKKWGDWFILCRTNADIELFKTLLAKRKIPTDTFKQSELTNAQIQDRLNADTVKILTVHSAKGLESPCVLSYNIRAYNDDEHRTTSIRFSKTRKPISSLCRRSSDLKRTRASSSSA